MTNPVTLTPRDMDGSCLPTASGVNRMLSIAAIAHRGATLLAGRMA
jgi:choline dehydrogenase-like flavoprotein